MRRSAEIIIGALFGLFAVSVHAQGVPKLDETKALLASQQVIGTTPPDFTLMDRRERPVRLSDYRGKPLMVSFIYTGCFTICPTQTRTLHDAVRGLDRMVGSHKFNVLSIGFNQPFDSPQAMRAFAAQNLIDYPNWEFLAPHAKIVEPLTSAFGFTYVETPAGFDHIVGVTILDAEGRIHSQVYGKNLTAEALGVPLRELLLYAPPVDQTLSMADLLDRVRILCTVYDADTGEYRYDWKLLLELTGGLAFFLSAGIYLWREWRSQRRARDTVGPHPSPAGGSQQA